MNSFGFASLHYCHSLVTSSSMFFPFFITSNNPRFGFPINEWVLFYQTLLKRLFIQNNIEKSLRVDYWTAKLMIDYCQ